MTYARKLALFLFILWVGLVISVVFITLQRTHRNLTDLQGHRILQRLLQLPQQLLAPQRAQRIPRQETAFLARQEGNSGTLVGNDHASLASHQQNPGSTATQTSQLSVSASVTPPRGETVSTLQRISHSLQGTDWYYRLETTGEITNYRQFTLTAPVRWVLDLPGRWQIQQTKAQPFSKGPVQSIVVGYHPQHLRVVFWIRKGVSAPAITTEAGQLVIKFGPLPETLPENEGINTG